MAPKIEKSPRGLTENFAKKTTTMSMIALRKFLHGEEDKEDKEVLVITVYHRHALELANGTKIFENRPVQCKDVDKRRLVLVHMGRRRLSPADYKPPAAFGEHNRAAMATALAELEGLPSRYGDVVAVGWLVGSIGMEEAFASERFTAEEKEHITGPFCHVLEGMERLPCGLKIRGKQGGFKKISKEEKQQLLAFLASN